MNINKINLRCLVVLFMLPFCLLNGQALLSTDEPTGSVDLSSEEIILIDYMWLMDTSNLHPCKVSDQNDKIESQEFVLPEFNADLNDGLTAYPNPNNTCKLNIEFELTFIPAIIMISDITGQILYQKTISDHPGLYTNQINLPKQITGFVILSVIQNNKTTSKKVLVN